MRFFFVVALLGFALSASAQTPPVGPRTAQNIAGVIRSTDTCLGGVAVSSITPTFIPGVESSTTTADYTGAYVENESASYSLYCSEKSNVSVATAGTQGKEIPPTAAHTPHAWATWLLTAAENLYCLASGAGATATVCLWK